MASYTSEQLYGPGWPCEELSGNYTFNISNPYPQIAYFTMETVRDGLGFYNSSSATNALGTYTNFNNVSVLITSSYIASIIVGDGGGSFDFEPNETIALSGSFFRGTGGIYIGVVPSGSVETYNLLTEDNNPLITENNNNLIWPI
jgi:hypothetical protein